MSASVLVRAFHEKFGRTIRARPTVVDAEEAGFRQQLHDEERRELHGAMDAGDLVGVADGLADLVYVLYGTALHYGIDLDAVVAEVHASNMTKSRPDGAGQGAEGPRLYRPPDVAGVLAAQVARAA